MRDGKCKCFHHGFAKLLGVLGFLAALAFLYTAWWDTFLWMHDANFFFMHVIVFGFMIFGTKMCGCCGWGKMGMKGGMGCACACGDCKGGVCNNTHPEGHQHM